MGSYAMDPGAPGRRLSAGKASKRTRTITVPNVDLALLAKQKASLVDLRAHCDALVLVTPTPEHREALTGIIHLLDAMEDAAQGTTTTKE